MRNIPAKHWVNNTEVKENGMVEYMSDYVKIEEIQYLLIKKGLNVTENRDLNEDFAVSYTHLDVYKRQVLFTKYLNCEATYF